MFYDIVIFAVMFIPLFTFTYINLLLSNKSLSMQFLSL